MGPALLHSCSDSMAAPKPSGVLTCARIAEPDVWVRDLGVPGLARAFMIAVAEEAWSQSAVSVRQY